MGFALWGAASFAASLVGLLGRAAGAHCEEAPARPPPEKAWFRLVIALLCAASFVVSAALLDEEVTSVRRARG